jgi:glycosyltransferase involved in cell wall biosynthesis
MDLSVIIPVFNEEANVEPVCREIRQTLEPLEKNFEIIFVNDGSNDNTRSTLDSLAQEDDKIKVVHLRRNFGQTAAITAGVDHASGDVIVMLDGDLQNDPHDIPRLLKKLEENFDVCSGWRKTRRDNFFTRTVPSRIANMLISVISGVRLRDYGCTLKAYRREVLLGVRLYGEMHRFIPVYAAWQGAKVTEIPVSHRPRIHGKSKYGLGRTFKVVLDLLVIKFMASFSQNPIYVFGGFGLVNCFLSLLTFTVMVYYKYLGGKSFVETPLPLVAVLFFLVGIISILMGFIAEVQMRTYYESQGKSTYIVGEKRNFIVTS